MRKSQLRVGELVVVDKGIASGVYVVAHTDVWSRSKGYGRRSITRGKQPYSTTGALLILVQHAHGTVYSGRAKVNDESVARAVRHAHRVCAALEAQTEIDESLLPKITPNIKKGEDFVFGELRLVSLTSIAGDFDTYSDDIEIKHLAYANAEYDRRRHMNLLDERSASAEKIIAEAIGGFDTACRYDQDRNVAISLSDMEKIAAALAAKSKN